MPLRVRPAARVLARPLRQQRGGSPPRALADPTTIRQPAELLDEPSGPRPSMVTGKANSRSDLTQRVRTMPAHDTTMSVDHQDLGRLAEPTVADIPVDR